MDTLQLKIFLSLSRTLNFTRTANEFFTSQPTVSHQLQALEEELGTKLLQRNSHHVELTEAGVEYVRYASQMLDLQSAAETRMRNLAANRPGYIRIAMLSSSIALFSRTLHRFSHTWPQVHVDVDMYEGSEMLRALSRLGHDLYFANEPMLPQQSDILRYESLNQRQLCLCVNRELLPQIDLNDWSSIGQHPFVAMQASDFTLSAQIEQLCSHRGIKPEIINYYNRADMLLLSVSAGIGLAILPAELADFHRPDNVVCLPISGNDALLRSVIAWKTTPSNPDADRFREMAVSVNREQSKEH